MEGLVKHYLAAVPVSGFLLGMASVETRICGASICGCSEGPKVGSWSKDAFVMLHHSVR